jgi:hypothetical protein
MATIFILRNGQKKMARSYLLFIMPLKTKMDGGSLYSLIQLTRKVIAVNSLFAAAMENIYFLLPTERVEKEILTSGMHHCRQMVQPMLL